jgi:protein-S-isoprenylcysteine O-methyltransferase Ste14
MERPADQPRDERPPPVLPARWCELRRDPAARLFAAGCALGGVASLLDELGSSIGEWIGPAATMLVVVALAILQLRWWRIKQYMWRELARYWKEERR